MRSLVVVVVVAAEAIASAQSHRFTFEVDQSAGKEHPHIVVRERGKTIARIDPAPGGSTKNMEVQFVAGDNLLATWSCGTSCEVGVLHSPRGRELASFSAKVLDLSPARTFAVVFDGTAGEPFGGGRLDLLDMRTGRIISSSEQNEIWNVCDVRWERNRITLLPCDSRTQPIRLRIKHNTG